MAINFYLNHNSLRAALQKTLFLFLLLLSVTVQAAVRFVKPTSAGSGSGNSWGNASANLQAMINASASGDQVWVAAGTYQPASGTGFMMKEGVKIYGGFAGNESDLRVFNPATNITILKGNNYSVIYNYNNRLTNAAVLDGFTITGGTGSSTDGGGVYNEHASPVLSNLIIAGNSAKSGNGMYINSASPVITNVVIRNNVPTGGEVASSGGIFIVGGSPVFTNVLISGNTGVLGGGLVVAGATPVLTNVTITGNTAFKGGAIYNSYGNTTIRNSIIYNNTTSNSNEEGAATGISTYSGSTTTITYSIVQGSYPGTGNLDADPKFTSTTDFTLQQGSPAINQGDPATTTAQAGTTDLAGNIRFQKGQIDIGAYESAFYGIPQLTTTATTGITTTNAILGGNVTANGGDPGTVNRGVVYSATNTTPTVGGTGVMQNANGTGTGTFSEISTGLLPNTKYYAQAYATNSVGTGYGGVQTFTMAAPPPVITSFSPASGPVGAIVTIAGSGFNTDAASNIVFFGATRATVSSATATTLTVKVPAGATYQYITVLNGATKLQGASAKPFVTTFAPTKGTITTADLMPKVDFVAGTNPQSVAIGDLDGDGSPDLAVANYTSNTVSVYRNKSASGSITAGFFADKVDYPTGTTPYSVAIGDLDGDGKPELAVANYNSNTVSVLHNTSVSGNISFETKLDYATGGNPQSVAIGDLDGDGRPDLATANASSNTVSVLRNTSGSGNITFVAKVDFITGQGPYSVSIGDLNGDGKPELATANSGDNKVSVLRNASVSGSITASSFAPKIDFTAGIGPISIAIGDLDGDDKPDLAVANKSGNSVSVLRNTSAGDNITFIAKVDFSTGTGPLSVAIGDIDGDGKADLAAASSGSNTVSVLRNTSASGAITANSFAPRVDFATGGTPQSVAIGDLNGDGRPDLATANYGSSTLSVLRNNPVIPPPVITSFSPANGPVDTEVTIVGSGFNTDAAGNIVFFGATRATVSSASATSLTVKVPVGATYQYITVLNGTTKLQGASAKPFVTTFTPNKGNITAADFSPKVDFATGNRPANVTIGDLDGDGNPDLVIANLNSNTVSIFRNISANGSIGASSFADKVDFTTGIHPQSVTIGDLDGDGKPDLVVANASSSTVSVLRNISVSGNITAGSFEAKVDFTTSGAYAVAIADLDGDGKPDLATANYFDNNVSVLRNTSVSGIITAGSFASKVDFATGTGPFSIATGDLNGDGKPDLVTPNYGSNTISVLRNNSASGTFAFAPSVEFATGTNPENVAIGDLDGDGKLDLATANVVSNDVSLLRNTSANGSIAFDPKVDFTTGANPQSIAIGDLDGDGKADLATANTSSNTVSVLRNTSTSGTIGTGSFTAKVDYATGNEPFSVAIGDLDGDGKADLVAANTGSATVSVLRNAPVLQQPPLIASFSPASGPVGNEVTITGSGFNADAAGNIVFFGATRAAVKNATATSLTVTAPVGATYQYITVLNGATMLQGASAKPFVTTFTPNKGDITAADFSPTVDFGTGNNPRSVAIGDLDGDGKPDLAVANSSSSSVSVYRNISASGTVSTSSFASKVDYATGNSPYSVAIGDLDGDGKPDLAVANALRNTVSVLRNTSASGTISFTAKVDFATGDSPFSVAIGDLDGDGKPDLALSNIGSATVSVLRNISASGSITASSFASNVDFITGDTPISVAIGDLDGDGKPDLAIANSGSNSVSLLRNTSLSGSITAGSFAPKVDFTTGANPNSVAIGDLDGDGKPDLAIANSGSNSVSLLRNTSLSGSIVFAAKADFDIGANLYSVVIGDLNGDGKPDLATANGLSNTTSVLRNTAVSGTIGAGSFAAKVDYAIGSNYIGAALGVAIGDLDGDGKADLIVAKSGSNTVSVLRNNPILPQPPVIASFSPASGPVGTQVTITGSGFNATAASNIVFFGATRATVSAASATSLTVTVPVGATYQYITVLNGTTKLQGASAKPFVTTFTPNKGNITAADFSPKVDFTTGSLPQSVAIGDLDGDGKPDLAIANRGSNTVSVLRNISASGTVAAGSFADKVDFITGDQPYDVAIGDLDGDGKPDLAITNGGTNTVSVLRNTSGSGSVSFTAKVDFVTAGNPRGLAIGDLDGDGKLDLTITNFGLATVSVLRNTSVSGTISADSFASKVDFSTAGGPFSVTIGDLDGDGKPDLATANFFSNTVSVLRNTSTSGTITAGSFAEKVNFAAGDVPYSVAIGDLDGDGKADLATANSNSNNVSVLHNTSASGTIAFEAKINFATGAYPTDLAIGDLDGDGKPDLATANNNNVNTVSVLRNTSMSGTIGAGSFAPKVDLGTGASPYSVAIGDLDGDGKADLAAANYDSNTVSVLRYNAVLPPTVQATNITVTGTTTTGATLGFTRGNGSSRAVFVLAGNAGLPTLTNNTTYTANAAFGSGSQAGAGWYTVYNGADSTVTLTGLAPGTTYRVMVTEYNGAPGSEQYLTAPATNNPLNFITTLAPTTVASITRGGSPASTNMANLSYTVTFAAPVTGVTAANFTLTSSGGLTGPAISGVTGSGTTYTVTVNAGTGSGTLQLNLANSTGISPTVSNVPYTSGESYTIDTTLPGVTLASSNGTSGSTISTTPFSFTAAFAKAVTGFTAAGITVTNGSVSALSGSGTSYTFSVTPVTAGTPTTIQVTAGAAQDGAGNGNTASNTYTLTYAAPSLTAGTLVQLSTCSGSASSAKTFTVNGSNLTGDVTLTPPSGIELSSDNSTYNASPLVLTPVRVSGTLNATIYVRIAASATTSPTGAISVASNGVTTQNVTVSAVINPLPTVTAGTVANISTATTSFSLPYTATGSPVQYSITTGTRAMSGFTAISNATLGSSPITVNIPEGTPAGTYDFRLTVSTATCSSAPSSFTVTVGDVPALATVSIASNGNNPAFAKTGDMVTLSFTATTAIQTPAVTIANHPVTAINTSGNSWKAAYTLTSSDAEGVVPFSIAYQTSAGITGSTVTTTTNNSSVTFDRTAPTVTLLSSNGASGSVTNTTPLQFSVSFSENVTGFSAGGITLTGGTLSGSISGSGPYTFTVTPDAPGTATTVSIAAGVARDAAGNVSAASSTYSLTYNQLITATPSINSPANGAAVASTRPVYTGTAAAGSTVRVYVDGDTLTGIATLSGTAWSFTQPTALDAGSHRVYVTAQVAGRAVSVPSQASNFTVLSAVATLSNLSITPGTLSPAFTVGTTIYTAEVNNSVSSITVTPVAGAAGQVIMVNSSTVASGTASGLIALNAGQNTIAIQVTAPDGITRQSYTLVVTRGTSTNNNLTSLTASAGALMPVFSSGITGYAITVPNSTASTTITPTATDANATLKVNGVTVTSGSASSPIALAVGITSISTVVTAQDGSTKTYTIAITRDKPAAVITFSPLPAKIYGDADFSPAAASTNTSTANRITYTSDNAAVATIVAGQVHIVGAGTANITASQPADAGYNTATPVIQQLRIGRAIVQVTADNKSRIYGQANPPLTVSYSGFVNGDNAGSLTTPPTASTTANTTTPAGSYPIVASGAASDNYTITYVTGMLTISPAARSIAFNSPITVTYGAADFSPGATASTGETLQYTSSDAAIATIVNDRIHIVGAGTTVITASLPASGNYTSDMAVTATLVVEKAKQTISSLTLPTLQRGGTYDLSTISSTSGLPVSFTSADKAIASVSGTILTGNQIGQTMITASQPGNQNYLPAASITFPVVVADLAGGNEVVAHKLVSPNGDGINDVLVIEGLQNYPRNTVTIINRNGVKVFEARGYDNHSIVFDGRSSVNGQLQQAGTYFYILEHDGQRRQTGWFVLKY
jgi:gliding motility-associated-like protein